MNKFSPLALLFAAGCAQAPTVAISVDERFKIAIDTFFGGELNVTSTGQGVARDRQRMFGTCSNGDFIATLSDRSISISIVNPTTTSSSGGGKGRMSRGRVNTAGPVEDIRDRLHNAFPNQAMNLKLSAGNGVNSVRARFTVNGYPVLSGAFGVQVVFDQKSGLVRRYFESYWVPSVGSAQINLTIGEARRRAASVENVQCGALTDLGLGWVPCGQFSELCYGFKYTKVVNERLGFQADRVIYIRASGRGQFSVSHFLKEG